MAYRGYGASGPYAYLVMVAHPDDETAYLSHGILQLGVEQGLRGAIFVLSSGEKGGCRGSWEMDEALAARREKEMERAAAVYRMDLLLGGFRDYGEERTPETVFEDAWDWEGSLNLAVKVIRDLRPRILISQDPDEAPGSPAHRAAARLAREAYKRAADSKFHPELGAPWRCQRHFSSMGDDDHGGYLIPGKGHATYKKLAEQAHDSQAADDWDLSEIPQHFTLQQGQGPDQGSDLGHGLELGALEHLAEGEFKPVVTRLYEGKMGQQLRMAQNTRWSRFIETQPPYHFRFDEPAVLTHMESFPKIDGVIEGRKLHQVLNWSDPIYRDAKAGILLGWNREGLYLGLEVSRLGKAKNQAPGGQYWSGDALELFLNPNPKEAISKRVWRSTRDRQMILTPDSLEGGPRAVGVSVGTFSLQKVKIAVDNRLDGYVLEAFIPAENFSSWNLKAGDQLRFEVELDLLQADGTRRQIHWHDLSKNAWFNPDGWGLALVR